MDVRSKQPIKTHLQKEDVQERILQYVQKGRDEATVTISRAAELFGITENKLRDWEEYGFLTPLRPGGPKGRRLYTPFELDKLAIIRELINAGYAASDIPPDIDKLWHGIRLTRDASSAERANALIIQSPQKNEVAINIRVAQARTELFWRYFTSHALRSALMLISEDMPNTAAGLVLPLVEQIDATTMQSVEDITNVGEALVGWLSQSGSSHTLLTVRPSFQYSSDFRVEALRVMKAGIPQTETATDKTIIVLEREAKPLTLTAAMTETIYRLLRPLYEDADRVRFCFGMGMKDMLDPATDLTNSNNYEDVILNGMADMVVRLGGQTEHGVSRWRFCSIFLPNYPASILSQQQRSLIVRAQSEHGPYRVGMTTQTPQEPFISSSIKAFQSGHIIYRPTILYKDMPGSQESSEELIHSSMAVPIEGSDGNAIAVIYVAASLRMAFTEADASLLRTIGRMIRALLATYQIRLETTQKLRAMISHPKIVDTQFQEFLSEDDFISYIEGLLSEIQSRSNFSSQEIVSFIAIDIDNQSAIANKYGDRMGRDLSRAVGMRIHSQLRAFKDESEYKLYHICADRFYILLKNMTLEQARIKAELLKQTLEGTYNIDPQRAPAGQLTSTEHLVTLTNITVRLGVASYPHAKLKEILQRYTAENAVNEVRMQITGFLEEELAMGKQRGGSVVLSWDPTLQGFISLP